MEPKRACLGMMCVLGVLVVLIEIPCVKAACIGVSYTGDVYRINEFNGVTTYIGSSDFSRLNALAANNTGTIFSVSRIQYNIGELIIIDPDTGKGSGIVAVNTTLNGVRGLAFSPTNQLYSLIDTGAEYTGGPDGIFIIDVNTGNLTRIGITGYLSIQSLVFSPDGILYGWDLDFGLLRIDTATGIATDVNPNIGGSNDIQTLDFSPNGTLYGTNNNIYTINSATGQFTHIASLSNLDIRGIVMDPTPEPATLSLLAIGGILLRRRKQDQSKGEIYARSSGKSERVR